MSKIVMKFGGRALETPSRFRQVAQLVCDTYRRYEQVVVVVSAMGAMTAHLARLARQVCPEPPKREEDMLLSVGERVSMALLAMALKETGFDAISLTGSQAQIVTCRSHTQARILTIRPERIQRHLDEGRVVIVAGFQGVSVKHEITTLGVGGSDISAVALGLALEADYVEFCKDVRGVYSHDPNRASCKTGSHRSEVDPELFESLNFDQLLQLTQQSTSVIHPRAVALAAANNIPLKVISYDRQERIVYQGTWIENEGERRSFPIYEEEGQADRSPVSPREGVIGS